MSKMKGAKKVIEKVIHRKLEMWIPAGMAANGPPLGTMLGQRGMNIAAFCKDFNNRTAHMVEGVPVPVRATINPDRSYNLTLLNPPLSYFIRQAAGIQRGSMTPNDKAGWITLKHVYEIAKIKITDPALELTSMEHMCRIVIGNAYTMGVKVVVDYDPAEYAEFLKEREEVVEKELQELLEIREAKILRK